MVQTQLYLKLKIANLVIVDAMEGLIIVDPTEEQVKEYEEKAQAFEERKAEWAKLVDSPSETKDGHAVELAANIGTPKDVTAVSREWCRSEWFIPY